MKSSLKTRAITGAVWMSIEMIGVQAASFVVFAVMAHYVAPRDFGLISISFIAVQSLQMLALYNVSTIAVRKNQVLDIDFTTAFWITTGLAIIAFMILFGTSGMAERLFRAPGLKPVLQAMSIVLLFMGISRTHETWLMRHFHFRALAIRGLAGAAAGGLVGVLLAIRGFGVMALVGQQITNATVTTLLLWIVCPWRPALKFSAVSAAEILSFMRHIAPNNLVYVINQNCDTFLVALFFGPISAGFYNVGKRIRLALQLVAGEPIRNIMLPALAEMQYDPERLRRGILSGLRLVCVFCGPAFFGTAVIAQDLIIVVFGVKWAKAIPVMEMLSFGGLALVLIGYNENIFVLMRRPLWCLYVSLAYTTLAILAILICVDLKCSSIALPFVLPYIIVLPLSAFLVSKQASLTFGEVAGAMLPGVGSATGMFLILQLAIPHLQAIDVLSRLFILGAVGGFSYLALLLTIWPATARELVDSISRLRRHTL